MRALYSALLYLLAPVLLLWLLWQCLRRREDGRRILERFGYVPAREIAVWVHAVSVGEVAAAQPLIRRLIARHPPGAVLVTTGTATGSQRVREAFGGQIVHTYVPYDLPHVVRRFVARLRPAQVIVMETELWPNLFRALAARGTAPVIANARLSPRSAGRYARMRRFVAATLADVGLIAAQSEPDAQRFRELGASPQRVQVVGNLKFDVEPPPELVARGRELRARFGAQRPVWVAASTHEGEEQFALAAHRVLRERFPDALLIVAPRHPQRFDAVARLIEQSGLAFTRRSASSSMPAHDPRQPVFLTDSLGELAMFFAAADLAFVGGSLVPVGGHNVLEPAALGLPVLFGPHMANFEPARDLLLSVQAAHQLGNALELAPAVGALLADPARRAAMGEAGRAAVSANRGALDRLMAILDASARSATAPA